jgi:hypothetical protein
MLLSVNYATECAPGRFWRVLVRIVVANSSALDAKKAALGGHRADMTGLGVGDFLLGALHYCFTLKHSPYWYCTILNLKLGEPLLLAKQWSRVNRVVCRQVGVLKILKLDRDLPGFGCSPKGVTPRKPLGTNYYACRLPAE